MSILLADCCQFHHQSVSTSHGQGLNLRQSKKCIPPFSEWTKRVVTSYSRFAVDCLQRHGVFSDPTQGQASPRAHSSPRESTLTRQGSNASYISSASLDLNLDSITSGMSLCYDAMSHNTRIVPWWQRLWHALYSWHCGTCSSIGCSAMEW